jgi:unsaturated rhamnogalacturonyl hydrolase
VLTIWKDYPGATAGRTPRWTYEQGVVLLGITQVWKKTGDQKYFDYIRQTLDHYVADDGTIRTYRAEEYNLDNVLLGRMLLLLYRETKAEKYRKGR